MPEQKPKRPILPPSFTPPSTEAYTQPAAPLDAVKQFLSAYIPRSSNPADMAGVYTEPLGALGREIWGGMTSSPSWTPPKPYIAPGEPKAPAAPAPGTGMYPSGFVGGEAKPGSMHATAGPEKISALGKQRQFNVGPALQGLQGAQDAQQGRFQLPTEELYKSAFGDPGMMAPGAPEFAQNELKTRLGDEAFATALDQKQMETIMGGLTAAHPAVQGTTLQAAQQKLFPNILDYQAKQFQENAQSDRQALQAEMQYQGQLQNAIARIAASAQGNTAQGKAQLAQLQHELDQRRQAMAMMGQPGGQ